MKTIVFAGTKGGIGKTTLCYNVASEAAKQGTVWLGDLDPQQSLAEVWVRRGETTNPRMLDNITTVSDTVRRLKQSKFTRDFFFIDAPGSNIPVIREAVLAADVVLLPVQPSPMDLLAQDAVIDLVERANKRDRALIVLTRVDARGNLGKEAVDWLAENRPYPVYEVRQRAAYARAAITGKPAGDFDNNAQREMTGLWSRIQEIANGSE
jgi:chromosome partitioning protein